MNKPLNVLVIDYWYNQYYRLLVQSILSLKEKIEGKYIFLATINSVNMIPLFADAAFNELLKRNPHPNISIKKTVMNGL